MGARGSESEAGAASAAMSVGVAASQVYAAFPRFDFSSSTTSAAT